MALSNPQLQVLKRLAKANLGYLTRFEVLEDIGHSSLSGLLKRGFVMSSPDRGGMIKITQAGLDAVLDHQRPDRL